MTLFLSTISVTPTLRISTLAALCLGLVAMAPLQAENLTVDTRLSHKLVSAPGQTGVKSHTRTPEQAAMEELHNTLTAGRIPPTYSADSERTALTTGTELLLDGGFEGGYYGGSEYGTSGVSGPWAWSDSPASLNPIWTDPPTHTGAPIPRMGAWCVYFPPFGPQTSRLYQTVSIPSGVTATLSFWLQVGTFETTHAVAYDTMTVSIRDTSGVMLGSTTYSNLDSNSSWLKHTLDVSAYAGRAVRLQFDTYEDVDNPTLFLLDDVSLLASASSASCVEDAYTMCLVNGRYKVTSHWKNQYATTPVVANLAKTKLTDKTGAFWIADADTYEYLIRFNTASNNGKIWLNVTTFTSVEFWVEVTDTVNGRGKEYHNAPGDTTMIWDPNTFIYP